MNDTKIPQKKEKIKGHGMPSNLKVQDRHTQFLEKLPENGYNFTRTAEEVGFAPSTAQKQQKRIYNAAIHKQEKILASENSSLQEKRKANELLDKVGVSREVVMERLRYIAFEQTKDLSTGLKAMRPFLASEDIHIDADNQTNITIPTLNVTMSKPKDGLTEPYNGE